MRRFARLTLLYTLEAIAAVLALSVVVFGAALWRLAEGPVNAEMVRPMVSEALLDAVDGDVVDIGALELSFDPALAALVITARDVSIEEQTGEVIVASELIEAALALDLLLLGRAAPVRLQAIGGTVSIHRNNDGRISGGLGPLDAFTATMASQTSADIQTDAGLLARLLIVEFSGVSLQIRDEAADWTGLFTNVVVDLDRSRGSISLDAQGDLITSAGRAPFALDLEAGPQLQTAFVDMRWSDLVPAVAAPRQGVLAPLGVLDAPFEAHLVFDASREEGLRAASLQVRSNEGVVRTSDRTVPLQDAHIDVVLDVDAGQLLINRARIESELIAFDVSGSLSDLSGFDDAVPSRARYALELGEGRLDLGGVFPEPIIWLGGQLMGDLDTAARSMGFDQLNVQLPAAEARLRGEISFESTQAGLRPNIELQGPVIGALSRDDVLAHWPVDFALGARDWVRDSILGGVVRDANLRMNLTAQALAAKFIENDALSLTFAFRDADVRYMSTMTPLLGLSGHAELRGNSLSLEGTGGSIGNLVADRIYVEIPRLNPKGAQARFGGSGRGSAREFLELVSEPPLSLAQDYNFDPEVFGGEGELAFEIRRPMRRTVPAENLDYSVTGRFVNVSGPLGPPGLDLSNGELDLEVNKQGVRAVGVADIAQSRADLVWTETFGLPADQPSSRVDLTTRMTARDLDRVGLPLRRFMDGVVGVNAMVAGRGMDFSAVDVTLDLEDAAIALPADLWDKASGEPASAQMRARFHDGAITLQALQLEGEGVDLRTSATLAEDGRLLSARAERVFVEGRVDLAADISRPEGQNGPLLIDVRGPFLDARDLFGTANPSGGGTLGADLQFEGAIDRLMIRRQSFTDVGLSLSLRPEGVEYFVFEADNDEGPVIVRFQPEPDTGVRLLSAVGPDAGHLLSAFTDFDNISGGQMRIQGVAPPLGNPGAVTGRLQVGDFTLNRMPLLARILAAGSLEGLGGLLSGQGIGFNRFETEFVWGDGVLEMRDSRVAGPALGATWTGVVNFDETRLDVDGTLLPSYGVNSVLGSVPLLGELLTSRQGEGVIGVTFSVSGPFDQTRVLANPLSALAPGVLRRIFEGTSAERELQALEARRREQVEGGVGAGPSDQSGEGLALDDPTLERP